MANALGDHLLERLAEAPPRDVAARLAALEQQHVALQLCLAALAQALERAGARPR